MNKFLCIYIKAFDDGEFNFYQTLLIRKVSEMKSIDNFNGLPTTTRVGAPRMKDENGTEAKRYWTN